MTSTPPAPSGIQDDDLPGMLALAKGVAEQRFPHTMDAQVWAAEFKKLNPDSDEGTMLGWFANAIMAGYDTAQHRMAQAHRSETGTTGETPRTDAVVVKSNGLIGGPNGHGYYVPATFARQLEREWLGMKSEILLCHPKIAELEAEVAALKRDAQAAVLAEREACAALAEEGECDQTEYNCATVTRIAKAIRARGQA